MDKAATETLGELAALRQTWLTLAPNIELAETLRKNSAADPALVAEPRVRALVRWLDNHERDIVALKTLVDAAEDPALDLSLSEAQVARLAAEKLADTLQQGRDDADSISGSSSLSS